MPTLRIVPQGARTKETLATYSTISPEDGALLQSITPLLSGKRILHINSAARGGGVAELLRGGCALERALGIESSWAVIEDATEFFVVTKKIHNGLQGTAHTLTPDEQRTYLNIATELREQFETMVCDIKPNLIILHDPQPLPLISQATRFAPVISRLHIDLSTPFMPIVELLMPMIRQASSVIVSSSNYHSAIEPYPEEQTTVIRPAIDPLTEKNVSLEHALTTDILVQHGIDTLRPYITQVSRFDVWKDPIGAIEAYRIAKQSLPTLQLVLAGFIEASDDPEALAWVEKTKSAASDDTDIHIFSDLSQLRGGISNALFVNALNTHTACTLQMSRREGFGLTITEAMWKEHVVIARPSRGAELQITHGKSGYLADTPDTIAKHIVETILDKTIAHTIGRAAKESVKKHFLLPHYVALNCQCYLDTLSQDK
ncbi:MAG: glycosyltransferase [Candidatus Moraniibacteriota bacterium]|nr:MAG: glycosyltransferase [Candidatus Moranbacteria bacterium]